MRGALVVLLAVARVAAADTPTGYQCQPGSPKVGVGCTCPAGFSAKRDAENVAVCKPTQKPSETAQIAAECAKVDAAIVRAFGGALAADELKKFKATVGKAAILRCETGPWRKEVRACFAKATTEEAAHECLELLPPMQRGGLEVEAARAHPIGVTVGKDRLELRGQIVFAQGSAELSSVSSPLVDEIAKTIKGSTLRVEIRTFSDTGEDADLTLQLAERRAQTLRRALLSAGVPAGRITAKGFGDKLPVASNATAWGRAKNRRIEFAIVPADPRAAPDRDQDGIADASDRCPDQPENINDFEDTDGCPDKKTTLITGSRIEIMEVISFKSVSTVLDADAKKVLDQIADILKRFPTMRIRLVGHTDNIEPDPVKLGAARARAVRDYLLKAGADSQRVDVFTQGESQPRAANSDEAGRAKNRRVEFEVL